MILRRIQIQRAHIAYMNSWRVQMICLIRGNNSNISDDKIRLFRTFFCYLFDVKADNMSCVRELIAREIPSQPDHPSVGQQKSDKLKILIWIGTTCSRTVFSGYFYDSDAFAVTNSMWRTESIWHF